MRLWEPTAVHFDKGIIQKRQATLYYSSSILFPATKVPNDGRNQHRASVDGTTQYVEPRMTRCQAPARCERTRTNPIECSKYRLGRRNTRVVKC